mgnify:CR=1 FL=1
MTTPAVTVDAVYSGFSAVFDSLTINDVVSVTPSANVKKIIAQGIVWVSPNSCAICNA